MARLTDEQLLIIKQKIEVLAGERGDRRQAAIRMIYLTQLQELIGKLTKSTADLQGIVDKINADVVDIRDDVTLVQTDVSHLQSDVGGLQTDVVQITGDISIIQQDLVTANQNLSTLQGDIADLQAEVNDLSNVTADVDQLQLDVATLQTGQTSVTNAVNEIKSDVTAVVIPAMTQGSVSAAPTAAEFNKLVTDVGVLHQALTDLKTAIM